MSLIGSRSVSRAGRTSNMAVSILPSTRDDRHPRGSIRALGRHRHRVSGHGRRTDRTGVRAGVRLPPRAALGTPLPGLGVVIARRVCDLAASGEVLASRTVKDLVTGSGIGFEDRGEHELKGVPERWSLFAVGG